MSETIKLKGFDKAQPSPAKLDTYTGMMESVIEKHKREQALLRHELNALKEKYQDLSDAYQNVGDDGVTVSSDRCGESLCIYAEDGKWLIVKSNDSKESAVTIESETYPDEIEVVVCIERTIQFESELKLEFDNREDYENYLDDPCNYVMDYNEMQLEQEMDDQLRSGDYDVTDQTINSVDEI